MSKVSKLISTLALLVTSTCFAWGPKEPPKIVVNIDNLHEAPKEVMIPVIGRVIANQEVDVTSKTSGKIVELISKSQAKIEKGEVIAKLNSTKEMIKLSQAKKQLALAEQELIRSKKLSKNNFLSQQQLDKKTNVFDQAKAELELSERNLQDKTIISPISGDLSLSSKDVGDYINKGEKIIRVYKLQPMFFEFEVTPELAKKLTLDSSLIITNKGKDVKAKVVYISTFSPTSHPELKIKAIVDTNDELTVGYNYRAYISTHNSNNYYQVASDVVRYDQEGAKIMTVTLICW